MTISFNACRITATVDASYFCFRSVIVAASIVGPVLEFFCKRKMKSISFIGQQRSLDQHQRQSHMELIGIVGPTRWKRTRRLIEASTSK